MKIAFASDNGTTISRHFGRAGQYVVVTIEEGREASREIRDRSDSRWQPQDAPGQDTSLHDATLAMIADCQIVVCGSMGAGMDQLLRGAGITPIRTRVPAIETAVERYLAGRLHDNIELVF